MAATTGCSADENSRQPARFPDDALATAHEGTAWRGPICMRDGCHHACSAEDAIADRACGIGCEFGAAVLAHLAQDRRERQCHVGQRMYEAVSGPTGEEGWMDADDGIVQAGRRDHGSPHRHELGRAPTLNGTAQWASRLP